MKLNPNDIAPSQNILKPDTIKYIFECLKTGRQADLPTTPIVRQDAAGKYVAIDGHNLLAARLFLKENAEVHVARSSTDGLPNDSKENDTRNKNLFERYETCLEDRTRIQKEGVNSFQDLIARYQDLFNQHRSES